MNHTSSLPTSRWKNIFFWFWIYTLLVIIWGAWVRISHSGNGCGDHYPLCHGRFIPDMTDTKTWVEFSHRLMSGTYGLVVFYLFFKIRPYVKKTSTRFLNYSLLGLMLFEAFIGAVLVKFELVAGNDSMLRLSIMSLHQISSFLLTGVTYLLYLVFRNNQGFNFDLRQKKGLLLFLLLPLTGAIAALSTTLFPSQTLWEGILMDLSGTQHPLIRYRIVHPILALVISFSFMYWLVQKTSQRLFIEFLVAIAIGVITLFTLSPIPLKLLHLTMAHYLWARVLDEVLIYKSGVRQAA